MSANLDPIDACLREVVKARSRVSLIKTRQVRAADDRDLLKAVSYAWFKSHRPLLVGRLREEVLADVDDRLRIVLDATSRLSSKTTYLDALKGAKDALASLRGVSLVTPAMPFARQGPPNFAVVASDPLMRAILERRWEECQRCLAADAPLAATVMMGGLLEALLVARANLMPSKHPLFRAKSTPIDPKTRKPLALTEWTLRPYIDVAGELGWITRSGKEVAAVLRDYRNYIHPEKERTHGVRLTGADAEMFWEVTRSIAGQLLASVTAASSTP